jgi:hypothetical protein
MGLGILILSHNTREITLEGIRKALISAKYCQERMKVNISILLVDNGSQDGTVKAVKKEYPTVRVLALPENVGTSRGNNAGLRMIDDEFVLLLNSDTHLEPETLYKSFQYMQKNPQCDVMMCKLVDDKGNFRPYGGHLPTPMRLVLWSLFLESIPILRNYLARIYTYPRQMYNLAFQVEWMPSCFYFMKREVITKTNGLDENIFFYMDDMEWSKRINKAGFQIYFNPDVQAEHTGGESSLKKWNFKKILQSQFDGTSYFMKKHYPKTANIALTIMRLGFLLRGIALVTLGKREIGNAYITTACNVM